MVRINLSLRQLLILILVSVIAMSSVVAISATGGNITYYSNATGNYKIHTFYSNGTFNVTETGNIEILVIGGGGGGGSAPSGGGGGAGGYYYNYSYPVSEKYNITVGLGGPGAVCAVATCDGGTVGWGFLGTHGQDSVLSNGTILITSPGGGGGAAMSNNSAAVQNGGSGGGDGGTGGATTAGIGTPPYGKDSGNGSNVANGYGAGGGGGAGDIGKNGTSTLGGKGGYGINNSINGTLICYAGGGGGSAYDAPQGNASCGGGVAGRGFTLILKAQNATNYTGGGGGGGAGWGFTGANASGGYGGTGIVIIRYPFDFVNVSVIPSNAYNDTGTNFTGYASIIGNSTPVTWTYYFNTTGKNVTGYLLNYTNTTTGEVWSFTAVTNTSVSASTTFTIRENIAPGAFFLNSVSNHCAGPVSYVPYYVVCAADPVNGTPYFTNFPINITANISDDYRLSTINLVIKNINGTMILNETNSTNYSTLNFSRILNLANYTDDQTYIANFTLTDYFGNIRIVSGMFAVNADPPNTSLTYPVNGSIYTGNYTGLIILNLSNVYGPITCSLNDSRWSILFDGNTSKIFLNNSVIPETSIYFSWNCSDLGQYRIGNGAFFFKYNVLNVTIFDIVNNSVITWSNISGTISSDTYYNSTYLITNGLLNVTNLAYGEYTATFLSNIYAPATYRFFSGYGETTNLNVYLSSSSPESVLFTIQDAAQNNKVIEDAYVTIFRYVNDTLTIVSVYHSDVTGRVQFNYTHGTLYAFLVSHPDYETKNFTLNPIIFSSYDINLVPTSSAGDYDGVLVRLLDSYVVSGLNNVSIIITQPDGSLALYGVNYSYGATTGAVSGTNVYGEILTIINLNISSTSSTQDTVQLTAYYDTGNGTMIRYFTIPIISNSTAVNTLSTDHGDMGLGVFERYFLVNIVAGVFGGFIAIYLGWLAGLISFVFIMGIFVFTHLISIYFIFIPGTFVVIYMIWRGMNP